MIYDLILISCLVIDGQDGMSLSKTCDGRHESYHTNMEKCSIAGKAAKGRQVFRDTVVIGSNETVESHRCIALNVQ